MAKMSEQLNAFADRLRDEVSDEEYATEEFDYGRGHYAAGWAEKWGYTLFNDLSIFERNHLTAPDWEDHRFPDDVGNRVTTLLRIRAIARRYKKEGN